MRLTHAQIEQLANKSKGYAKDTTFNLRNISACAYVGEGGFNSVYDTVFFTVIHIEYEIFPDGSVTARNLETGGVIE